MAQARTRSRSTHSIPDLSGKINLTGTNHPIGIGQHSDIYVGAYNGADYAGQVVVKVIRGVPISDEVLVRTRESILVVLEKWMPIRHKNVVRLLGVAHDIPYIINIIVPYYERGNIIQYLKNNKQANILCLVAGVANGLEYLHFQGVLHKDLRGSKVLVDQDGNALLTDIGLGPVLVTTAFTTVNVVGAGRWQAPEVIQDEGLDSEGPFTRASDVYCFSMLCVEVLTLDRPFNHRKLDTVVIFDIVKGLRPHKPENMDAVGEKLWPLIESCWAQDPQERPDMTTVCAELRAM